jgi:hypothetical protein
LKPIYDGGVNACLSSQVFTEQPIHDVVDSGPITPLTHAFDALDICTLMTEKNLPDKVKNQVREIVENL